MADIKFVVSIDSTSGVVAIEKLGDALKKLGITAGDTGKAADDLDKSTTSMAGAMAVGALAAQTIQKAFVMAKAAVTDMVKAAMDEESATSRLSAALEVTGRNIGENLGVYKDFAEAQQKSTTYSRDEVMSAAALALQMTKLSQQGIKQVVEGAEGLAYVFGGDLLTRTRQVADGMSGVYTRLLLLIPALKGAGSEEEKHRIFVDVLAKSYAAAQQEVNTTAGALKQAKNVWTEFTANIGAAIIAMSRFLEIIRGIESVIEWARNISGATAAQQKLNEAVAKGTTTAEQFRNTLQVVVPSMKEMGDVIAKGPTAWEAYKQGVSETDAWLVSMKPHVEAWAAAWGKFFGDIATKELTIKEVGKALEELQKLFASIGEVSTAPDFFAPMIAAGKKAADEIKAAMDTETIAEEDKVAFTSLNDELAKSADDAGKLAEKFFLAGIGGADAIGLLDDALKEMVQRQRAAESGLAALFESVRKFGGSKALEAALVTPFKNMGESGLLAYIRNLQVELAKLTAAANPDTDAIKKVVKELQVAGKALDDLRAKQMEFVQGIGNVFNSLGNVFGAYQASQQQAIQNTYDKQVETINATIKDETKKNAALAKAEAERVAATRKLNREAAMENKVISIANVIINVAEAIMKGYAQLGIFGTIFQAFITALGAIEVGIIAAAPIPAAHGFEGMVTAPTTFLAGEAGPEYVSIRNRTQGLGGGMTVNVNSPLVVTSGLADSDLERAGSKLFQVIKNEARRYGRTM